MSSTGADASDGSSGSSGATGVPGPPPPPHRQAPVGLAELLRERADILGVVAAGGALGSAARWALTQVLPREPAGWPLATWVANVSGALLLGALVGFVTQVWRPSRLVRPFWGIGVLGGYTTFSTYALETHLLVLGGQVGSAAAYALVTLAIGIPAAWLGENLARAAGAARGGPGACR